jgi:hypothetical protein
VHASVAVAVLVMGAGFAAAGAFRFRRMEQADGRRREARAARKRQHHVRGSEAFELDPFPHRPAGAPPDGGDR